MEASTLSTISTGDRQFHLDLGLTNLAESLPTSSPMDSTQSSSNGTESTIMNRLKKTASIVKNHIPFAGNSTPEHSMALEGAPVDVKRAWSLAPVTHRENSAKRALLDSMPSLPSMPSMPSIDSLTSHSFFTNSKTKRRYFSSSSSSSKPSTKNSAISSSNPGTPPESDLDSDHDSSPPSTPPLFPHSTKTSRTPSSSHAEHASPSSSMKDPLSNLHGNVLMMGGFRGSVLRDPVANMRIWIPLKVPTGIRKVTLALGLTEEDEERSKEKIVGTKMLTHVGPIDLGRMLKHTFMSISNSQQLAQKGPRLSIPFVPLSVSTHNSTSTTDSTSSHVASQDARENPPLRVESWGYDFRLKLETPSKELVEKLTRLKEESKMRGEGPNGEGLGTVVICHSMGGLVVLHALSQALDPTIFRGIIFAGTPFQGCVNVLGPLGLDQGFRRNPGVGSPAVVFSWRSAFYFLPRGKPYVVGALDDEDNLDPDAQFTIPSTTDSTDSTDSTSTSAAAKPSAEPQEVASPVSPSPSVSSWSSPSTWSSPFSSNTTPALDQPEQIPTWQSHTKPPLEALFHGCFEDHYGNPIPINFHDPLSWSKYCFSPLTAGLYGNTITGETVEKRPVVEKKAGKKGGGDTTDFSLPLPGAPGTLGESDGISRDGMVGKVVEAGQEAMDNIEGEEDPALIEEQMHKDEIVKKYLEGTLKASLEFWNQIDNGYDDSKAHLYPPVAVITNSKIPTVRGVQVKNRKSIPAEKYDSLLYGEGDGIVPFDSAKTLPGGWGRLLKGVVETSHGHVSMLSDIAAVRKAVGLLALS